MCLLPLAKSLSPTSLLGTAAGLTSFVVIEETIGRLQRGYCPPEGDTREDYQDGVPVDDSKKGDAQNEGVQVDGR
jgi:hypothetical protein